MIKIGSIMTLNINYKYALAAIAIPEACRAAICSVRSKENRFVDDYITSSPLGLLKEVLFNEESRTKFLVITALETAAYVATYSAIKSKSIGMSGLSVVLCGFHALITLSATER